MRIFREPFCGSPFIREFKFGCPNWGTTSLIFGSSKWLQTLLYELFDVFFGVAGLVRRVALSVTLHFVMLGSEMISLPPVCPNVDQMHLRMHDAHRVFGASVKLGTGTFPNASRSSLNTLKLRLVLCLSNFTPKSYRKPVWDQTKRIFSDSWVVKYVVIWVAFSPPCYNFIHEMLISLCTSLKSLLVEVFFAVKVYFLKISSTKRFEFPSLGVRDESPQRDHITHSWSTFSSAIWLHHVRVISNMILLVSIWFPFVLLPWRITKNRHRTESLSHGGFHRFEWRWPLITSL